MPWQGDLEQPAMQILTNQRTGTQKNKKTTLFLVPTDPPPLRTETASSPAPHYTGRLQLECGADVKTVRTYLTDVKSSAGRWKI